MRRTLHVARLDRFLSQSFFCGCGFLAVVMVFSRWGHAGSLRKYRRLIRILGTALWIVKLVIRNSFGVNVHFLPCGFIWVFLVFCRCNGFFEVAEIGNALL